jgi:hypothetical protein
MDYDQVVRPKVTPIPKSLKYIFRSLPSARNEREAALTEYRATIKNTTYSAGKPVALPLVGTYWKSTASDVVHRVTAIAQHDVEQVQSSYDYSRQSSPRQTHVIHETLDHAIFSTELSYFKGTVNTDEYSGIEGREAPRFVQVEPGKEWSWWYPYIGPRVERVRMFLNRPMTFNALKSKLSARRTRHLYVMNAMKTSTGLPDILFETGAIQKGTSRSPVVIKIPASWLPIDLTDFLPADSLRDNPRFLSLIGNKHVVPLRTEHAYRVLNSKAGRAEKKRVYELYEDIKRACEVRNRQDGIVTLGEKSSKR